MLYYVTLTYIFKQKIINVLRKRWELARTRVYMYLRMLYSVTMTYIFKMKKCAILTTVKAGAKTRIMMAFTDVNIRHRTTPPRTLFSETLTFIFKIEIMATKPSLQICLHLYGNCHRVGLVSYAKPISKSRISSRTKGTPVAVW